MESGFIIEVDMMAQGFWSSFCSFNLGEEAVEARRIFNQLVEHERGLLRFSLVRQNGDQCILATKYCILNQLEANAKMLAKEIFKIYNFG